MFLDGFDSRDEPRNQRRQYFGVLFKGLSIYKAVDGKGDRGLHLLVISTKGDSTKHMTRNPGNDLSHAIYHVNLGLVNARRKCGCKCIVNLFLNLNHHVGEVVIQLGSHHAWV